MLPYGVTTATYTSLYGWTDLFSAYIKYVPRVILWSGDDPAKPWTRTMG